MRRLCSAFKFEYVHQEHFKTRAKAMRAIMVYIGYYNTERRHSWLGDVSLTQAEGDAVVMSLDSYNCNIETVSCC